MSFISLVCTRCRCLRVGVVHTGERVPLFRPPNYIRILFVVEYSADDIKPDVQKFREPRTGTTFGGRQVQPSSLPCSVSAANRRSASRERPDFPLQSLAVVVRMKGGGGDGGKQGWTDKVAGRNSCCGSDFTFCSLTWVYSTQSHSTQILSITDCGRALFSSASLS